MRSSKEQKLKKEEERKSPKKISKKKKKKKKKERKKTSDKNFCKTHPHLKRGGYGKEIMWQKNFLKYSNWEWLVWIHLKATLPRFIFLIIPVRSWSRSSVALNRPDLCRKFKLLFLVQQSRKISCNQGFCNSNDTIMWY